MLTSFFNFPASLNSRVASFSNNPVGNPDPFSKQNSRTSLSEDKVEIYFGAKKKSTAKQRDINVKSNGTNEKDGIAAKHRRELADRGKTAEDRRQYIQEHCKNVPSNLKKEWIENINNPGHFEATP